MSKITAIPQAAASPAAASDIAIYNTEKIQRGLENDRLLRSARSTSAKPRPCGPTRSLRDRPRHEPAPEGLRRHRLRGERTDEVAIFWAGDWPWRPATRAVEVPPALDRARVAVLAEHTALA